jgi:hypothetical protein
VDGHIDPAGRLAIALYFAQRGWLDFDGPAPIHRRLGEIVIDGASPTFMPEPATALLVALGLIGLAAQLDRARS